MAFLATPQARPKIGYRIGYRRYATPALKVRHFSDPRPPQGWLRRKRGIFVTGEGPFRRLVVPSFPRRFTSQQVLNIIDQSSALKREAAIKAMSREGKLTMIRKRKKPSKAVRQVARLQNIPNIGPAVAADLRQLGITTPDDLPGCDPYALNDDLWRITGQRHDPCLLDTFIAAVRYMEGAPKKPWWKYTAERKREMARRSGEADLGCTTT